MAYLRTKLEQSSFSHFRDMKEDPKRKTIWGDRHHSRSSTIIIIIIIHITTMNDFNVA